MRMICSKGNKETEGRFVTILKQNHITGWRRHFQIVGTPDFAFPQQHLAVFIDGCFWHGCPWHMRVPHSNQTYWRQKIAKNMSRDRKVRNYLKKQGWRVIRFWHHQLAHQSLVTNRLKIALTVPATVSLGSHKTVQ